MKHFIVATSIILMLISQTSIFAVSNEEIITALQIADKKLMQGHISYHMIKNIDSGVVVDKRNVSVELYYNNDGRYHETCDGNIGQYPKETIYDGKDIFVIEAPKAGNSLVEVQIRDTSYPLFIRNHPMLKEYVTVLASHLDAAYLYLRNSRFNKLLQRFIY